MIREIWVFTFYMGINIAAAASLIVGYVGEEQDGTMDLVLLELEWLSVNCFTGEDRNIFLT